ncbi:MAG: RtcB family protein [Lachnospiraceae bacterium]|nr:RtcB family protein [Lachnospiraceae bacterium]
MEITTIQGQYAAATVFTDDVEEYAAAQIKMICDNEVAESSVIRVMPDVHPGKVGPIGLTMTVGNRIVPALLGEDVGCGMLAARISAWKAEFQKLDSVIRENVPAGFAVYEKSHRMADEFDLTRLRCYEHISRERALRSLGTLGGGNHFIEVDKGDDGIYVVIHTGSRHLGREMTEYYLKEGQKRLKEKGITVPFELTWLEGDLMEDYLADVKILMDYASLNRRIILKEILKGMKWKALETTESVHNCIGKLPDGRRILRKGATSALAGEPVIIPINMRDGVILGVGKGNPEWNCSAPHGSGRKIKRTEVGEHYTVSDFKAEMKGIWSTSIGKDTLDEAPFAYRGLSDIAERITDTVEITSVIRPIYSFKAGNEK